MSRAVLSQPGSVTKYNGRGSTDDPRSGSPALELAHIKTPRMDRSASSGLRALEQIDSIVVRQQMAMDLKAGCGSGNTYEISDKYGGDKLFFVSEEDNCCCRWSCGPHRMFHITVFDKEDTPVLHFDREGCRCDWFCCLDCCCCQHKLMITDNRGEVLGTVRERFHILNLKADVMDVDGNVVNKIRGPSCACRCCSEINFDILDKNGEKERGFIFKKWQGIKEWVNVDHENFEMQFPEGATVTEKAILIGAAFLVDFMYFEMT